MKPEVCGNYPKRSRQIALKFFNYNNDSHDYDSKDGKWKIAHIEGLPNPWVLLGVTEESESKGRYSDGGEYRTLIDALDYHLYSVLALDDSIDILA
jgi:hypothetical protein